jgi:hypothetical protein
MYYTWETLLIVFLRTFGRRRPPTVFSFVEGGNIVSGGNIVVVGGNKLSSNDRGRARSS